MDELFEIIRRESRIAKSTLDRFLTGFAQDPAYAFQWGEDSMRAAAALDVWSEIAQMAGRQGVDLDWIATKIQAQALQAAGSASSSTSATQNLMRVFRTAALAKATEELVSLAKYEAKIAA